jgi:hypothetical protein
MKRPAFQFYPSDWLRDTALRSCSTGARGLWIDMICYMHQGNPYGHLKVGDKVILPENLARMVGETLEAVRGWLDELKLAGVYDVAEDGSISSRRMIRDENLRQVRALGGKLGGNPALKKVDKVNLEDNQEVVGEVKEKPTPSSSSSSSNKFVQVDKPEGVTDETWQAFILVRRAKKAPITKLSMAGIEREALAKGRTVPDAIRIVCERGWTTYKAEWDKQEFGSSLDDQFAGAL